MIIVSIVCNTYNHEKYIRDTLESFVNQKTDFEYEILVYDDASTDNTVSIIKEYEKNYPNLIKPIYQTVNQYSRKLKPGVQNRKRATGKYVAICEGDDYWIDQFKLQKQVDYMEKHSDCTFCFTNGLICYGNDKPTDKKIVPWDKNSIVKKNDDYDVGEVELLGYIPTCAFLYRNGLNMIEVSDTAFQGDIYIKLSMTSHGYAHFINEPMVVYRRGVSGSETARWAKDKQHFSKICDRYLALFNELLDYFDSKYENVIHMRICQWKIHKYFINENYAELKKIIKTNEIKNLRAGNFYSRLRYSLLCRFPKIVHFIRRLKNINR